jgi:3-deoxy-D-manno-octulosonate 8-phosphate phosphatase (KDO 8-P phosphatase)
MAKDELTKKQIQKRASRIKLVLVDVDGVLTDTGIYYSAEGEAMKRFSIRDGMGVERLNNLANVECGIVSGEDSDIVRRRAEKLKIEEIHLGIKYKADAFEEILQRKNLTSNEVAYIGDDTNDLDIMLAAGLTACPADATKFARDAADIVVKSNGGHGAFRDFAEIIIQAKLRKQNEVEE